ncbi:copper amine oxidase N-terminal domain-containing protein [Cohnella herbarum]|uniref:Copper amine oxidase N-terminal domain-containing protein n=1 Tax=Cohnella herbarum TaxID=2728023 RepID=A0A7Z2ZPG4_9BACL|nr:copper amine oxidase N-terminal domain-containing protein [Cohnella herbarum]QJD85972.1 copper amine oxidase N-terminal domain-containing protein [Cohnella herbarum]
MKKTIIALFGITLTAAALLPNQSYADNQPFVIQGKTVDGRTLVPVRYISAGLGADVKWNQQAKTVSVLQGDTHVILKVDSNKVLLNDKIITIDVPARNEKGVIYVPIRFIGQALGGTIAWNSSNRTADVSLGDKQVRVTTESTFNTSKIPQATLNTLIQKANEAADLSSIAQIRTHFKPYFTDSFINRLIQQRGLKIKAPFNEIAYSNSNDKVGQITQTSTTADKTAYAIERTIVLTYSKDRWLVDSIVFTTLFP